MPKVGHKRKKTRTHVDPIGEGEDDKIPRCFVVKQGTVDRAIKQLVQDFRHVCAPYSALKLKESRLNKLRDFVSVASHFKATHLHLFTQTEHACYFKLGRIPHGPTLTFKLAQFSTVADVKAGQKKPRNSNQDFLVPPLLILNGFRLNYGGESATPAEEEKSTDGGPNRRKELELVATCLKSMFPAVDVNTFTVRNCRRVVMFHWDCDKKELFFRHYAVKENAVAGVSRGVQKLIDGSVLKKSRGRGIEDLVAGGGCESDSEAGESLLLEGQEERRGSGRTVAVRLVEVGPRMTLQLVKGEAGFFEGAVLFHEFMQKSVEEQAALAKKHLDDEQRQKLKEAERKEEEAKREEARAKRDASEQKKLQKAAYVAAQRWGVEATGDLENESDGEEIMAEPSRAKRNPFAWHRKETRDSGPDTMVVEFGDSNSQKHSKKAGAGKKSGVKSGGQEKGRADKGKGSKRMGVMDKFRASKKSFGEKNVPTSRKGRGRARSAAKQEQD